jgi:hypothetical protein
MKIKTIIKLIYQFFFDLLLVNLKSKLINTPLIFQPLLTILTVATQLLITKSTYATCKKHN